MNPEIFVFTAAGSAAQEHYQRTIVNSVPRQEVAEHDPAIAAHLSAAGLESFRCWGSIPGPGNLRSWKRMQPGHWAMLYTGGGEFPFFLRVAHKARSSTLARHLWGSNEEDKTWELMFFFDAIEPVRLDVAEVRASLGYDEDWWPQGLQYPTPDHQEVLLGKFGSLEAFVEFASAEEGPVETDAAPSAAELLLGGLFKGAPTDPPKPRQPQPSDPDVSGRGHLAHEQTVEKLSAHVGPGFRKGTPGINHDGGWPHDGGFSISEVKSINSRNEVGQLQKGLGQVLHNRFKAERHGIEDVSAYLIAEREPANSELWRALAAEHGVVFSWPERFEADIDPPTSG